MVRFALSGSILSTVYSLFLFSSYSFAETPETKSPEAEFIGIAPIYITSSRIPQTEDNTISAITVITREEIEDMGAKSISDLLQTVPGVSIQKYGGKGQLQSLSLRGSNSTQTLVLVDGKRVNSATAGSTAFNFIPINNIERIEVNRGARSSIHGSDAIGGVINIITHKKQEKPTTQIGTSFGGENTQAYRLRHIGQTGAKSLYTLSLNHFTTEGFDVTTETSFSNNEDKDNYRNSSGQLVFEHLFSDTFSTKLNAIAYKGNTAFDNIFGGDETNFDNYLLNFSTHYKLNNFKSNFSFSESRDKQTTFGNGIILSDGSIIETRRQSIDWDNIFSFKLPDENNILNTAFGANWYEDDVSASSVEYDITKRSNSAVYTEFKIDKINQHFELGYRLEDNEQFGGLDNFNIGLQHDFCDCFKTSISYSTGFRAPTFNDLYWPSSLIWPSSANPVLRPEKSKSNEINIKGHADGVDWLLSFYTTEIEQAILYNPLSFSMENIGEVETRGQEASIEFTWLQTNQRLSLEWVKSKNKDKVDPNYEHLLPFIPEKSLKWNANRQWNNLSVNATLTYLGHRYLDPGNTSQLGSFSTVDVNIKYRFNSRLTGGLRIENIFDKKYIALEAFGDAFVGQRRLAIFDINYTFN